MAYSELPGVPVRHADFIPYVAANPTTPLPELLEPFKQYDAKLREVFAQEPSHPLLDDQYLNVVPVFGGHQKDLRIRARNLESESKEEKEKYVMPLSEADRRPNGSPAMVHDLERFQHNFAIFSESSLADLNWSNVVAAGSSVTTCLLPVPEQYNKSKKALRHYYHERIAPASDVDLFMYGLSEEEAIKKIIEIEQCVKDSILTEVTTIRTKNAVTIVSQYPTRHVQIVLRNYKSIAEILTGFDVDCSCAAYDGKQVYASPRALIAYMTQINTVDLTRRSPSYENRLSKYSHRGFEVYWPMLDRSRIDPTIFERNFSRTVGLARLLVLERLPSKSEREDYMDTRRRERGRPAINRRPTFATKGNIKDRYEDEVAEWVDQEDVSDYHTFTIPYGPKYHAKHIEKMLYTKDLLLNAEWNKRDDREVNLHRHPAFFGYAKDVIHDCCGFCPKPKTPEEHDVAEEEAKVYVSGDISFIKDDPGRQAIGSFHPLTDDDWTEMAYVGNTARLCQAIVDCDLEHVEDWLAQEGSDPNCRDYTGRTPLHLAAMLSTPEIVQLLIQHGSRLVARLADGRTALHLAAARGNLDMVRMILQKSEENEEEEAKKEEARKQARIAARETSKPIQAEQTPEPSADSDIEFVEEEDLDDDVQSTTTGSFVKVKEEEKKASEDAIPEDEDGPDVYDVNVLSWDTRCSPLHYAILNGHTEVVRELVQTFGADPLLPIKLLSSFDRSPQGAILTLVLALQLPLERAKAMTQTLLEIGASSAQADMRQTTALHYVSLKNPEVLDTLFEHDEPAARRAIDHLAVGSGLYSPNAQSPLMSAISAGNAMAAMKLLEAGSAATVEFKDWIKSVGYRHPEVIGRDAKRNQEQFEQDVEQPVVLAVQSELPEIVIALLERGADPNSIPKNTATELQTQHNGYGNYHPLETLLDMVRNKIQSLNDYRDDAPPVEPEYRLQEGVDYFRGIEPGSYMDFIAKMRVEAARLSDKTEKEAYEKKMRDYIERKGVAEKQEAIKELAEKFVNVEKELLARGAKTFAELRPDVIDTSRRANGPLPRHSLAVGSQPFKVEFDFAVHDLTEETREAYLKLFQAAWDGDLETIKSLTLAPWGAAAENIPLKIATWDRNATFTWSPDNNSPFTIAVLRGHNDVARAILDIAYAQYERTEEEKVRYRLAEEEDDGDSDSGGPGISKDLQVYKEIIDDRFTVDVISEVATQVKSRVSPLGLIGHVTPTLWSYGKFFAPDTKLTYGLDKMEVEGGGYISLLAWAVTTNDKDMFKLLVDLDLECRTGRWSEKTDSSANLPALKDSDFLLMIKYGRLDMLTEVIRRYGAGLDLQSLVKQSGVKLVEKPKYYQGLSVHGRKRADWVSAARGTHARGVIHKSPPLLQAAFKGSLATVEWFLSDAPARLYKEFAETYKDHKFVSHLNAAAGGFDKVLSKWLNARNEYALHCAVMAKPTPESMKLIQYLIKAMPDSLNLKTRQGGRTPLALAFSLWRFEAAKLLIEAGADQTTRNDTGANIIHLLLCSDYTNRPVSKSGLKKFLNLIDKRLVPSLLTERSSYDPGSLTPLARWLRHAHEGVNVIRTLLEYAAHTNNEHLEMLDGSGDTPFHFAVKEQKIHKLKIMLEYRPDLLYRENSVGRTPYELAEDAYIAQCVAREPSVVQRPRGSVIQMSPASFVKEEGERELVYAEGIYRLCQEWKEKYPGKRRLVSLLDANEVAKRLASKQHEKKIQRARETDEMSDAGEVDGDWRAGDGLNEVNEWYREAEAFV